MKKKLVLVGLIGFGVLFGCSQVSQDVEANYNKAFEELYSQNINNTDITTVKHRDTGCYWLISDGHYSGGVPVQMMVEKDGITVPYCEK